MIVAGNAEVGLVNMLALGAIVMPRWHYGRGGMAAGRCGNGLGDGG